MAISRRWASTIVALMLASLAQSQAASADSASVLLLPDRTVLYGPQATQRLVVESRADGRFAGDVTEQATFATSDPKVVVVENDGVVRAVGDGSAVISAKVGNQLAIATVEVQGTGQPFAWSFRNHVLSVLTKAGCNSGACHGAAAGKNGFRLTLRGFDPQADHNVLTRQALGRRIVKTEPARSLMLLKPTTTINHAGGKRFDVGSLEYRVLAEWIAAGTPPPSEDDPHVDRLEVFPAEATLQPPASQQILVRAHFSDGHMEDVTRWAKYASTDDNTATVDDTGRITVQG
ncbi:MAG: hypothetical protein HY000_11060, partial [Planctomycetes bacterium]|nr:hypothetical protein [Planctomycetota bacterium]